MESDRVGSPFTGSNPDTVVQWQNEDLAIANVAFGSRSTAFDDGLNGRFNELLVDGDLQLDLAPKINGKFIVAIFVRFPLLSTESLAIHDCQAKNFDLAKCRLDRFEMVGLNNGDDQLHGVH